MSAVNGRSTRSSCTGGPGVRLRPRFLAWLLKIRSCVHIYSKMGLWENSVDLALEKGDLELAKANADKPEDDKALRKKLWLKIARYVVQDKNDIKRFVRPIALLFRFRFRPLIDVTSVL